MKKPLPVLRTDEEAERFVAEADLTDYDLSEMRLVRFEFQPKGERVNMRLPKALLDAVKAAAAKARALWAEITPMARREWIRWVSSAKQAETRDRRIENDFERQRSHDVRLLPLSECRSHRLCDDGKRRR